MSFQKDNTWDEFFMKKTFTDDSGVFFKDGPKWASYYGSRLLGYFKTEREAENAFLEHRGLPPKGSRRY